MTLRPLLIANFDVTVGGGEVGLILLAEGLIARGHQPLVARPGPGPLAAHLPRCQIAADVDDATTAVGILAKDCDIVHVFSTPAAAIAVNAASGLPIVWHALVPNANPLDATLAPAVDAIVCNSRATANRFSLVGHVHVVPNGVRVPRPTARSLGLSATRRTVGIIGPTCSRKGQLKALPALKAVIASRDDVDVALIGRVIGTDGRMLTAAAADTCGRIRLHGFVPDVADLMHELSLVLVPSRSEGFGRVAVEALRAGVPVLACPVEGLVETLAALPDPWLPADPDDWADRMLHELDRPTPPDVLRSAADRFDVDRYVDAVLDVCRSVVSSRATLERDPKR